MRKGDFASTPGPLKGEVEDAVDGVGEFRSYAKFEGGVKNAGTVENAKEMHQPRKAMADKAQSDAEKMHR